MQLDDTSCFLLFSILDILLGDVLHTCHLLLEILIVHFGNVRAVRHILFSEWPVLLGMVIIALLVNVPLAVDLVLDSTAQFIQERVSFWIVYD